MGNFEYTPEWYATDSVALWLPEMNSAEELLYHYTDPTIEPFIRNGIRFDNEFQHFDHLSGRLLELGFNSGLTVYRLAKRYPKLIVDGIDFNPALEKVMSFIEGFLPNIGDIWLGDTQNIKKTDEHYDFITSIDYFEHLPRLVYYKTLRECKRVLKPGGIIWVYFGKPPNEEHINRRDDAYVIDDFERLGFRLVSRREILAFKNEGD